MKFEKKILSGKNELLKNNESFERIREKKIYKNQSNCQAFLTIVTNIKSSSIVTLMSYNLFNLLFIYIIN